MALPPVLPTGSSGSPSVSVSRYGQNHTVSATQQKRDIEGAAVSMNQILSGRAENKPQVSVHSTDPNSATTSITRPNKDVYTVNQNEYDKIRDENADYRRYSYIRELIKERKQKEAAEAKALADAVKKEAQSSGFQAGIGKGYHKTGATSFRRRMYKMMRDKRSSFKNLSKDDREALEEIIESQLEPKRTGSKINRLDRKKMGIKAYQKWKKGEITKEDFRDFKRVIGGLE